MEKDERFKKAQKAALIGMAGNIVLAIVKWVFGTLANSRALIADAVNSASDVAGSIVVYMGVKIAKRPPDEDHPYGHGKAESIAAIVVSVLLFIVGIEIFRSSIESFFHPIHPPKLWAVFAIFLAIVVKELLYRYTYRLGKQIKSDALLVNAQDHRADVLSSIAALIGILASVIGEKLGANWLMYADPVASLFVALLVFKTAWEFGSEALHNTLDHVLHEEDTVHLREAVLSVPGVKKMSSLHAREHGHYIIVDLKISVDPYITVEEGHLIGKNVKKRLMEEPNIQNVLVHINPYSDD